MAENDNAALSAEADEMLKADRQDLGRLTSLARRLYMVGEHATPWTTLNPRRFHLRNPSGLS